MGQALYRQYRPKSLAEVVGQEHITETLLHALEQDKLGHAYLFTGPRGVGKTSIARILAHEINKLPYEDDAMHLDIIEIDAASNRRIDEIRDLRDKVHTAPSSAKYKVYIIDEVHMLTREAFNALLKTLEEPPAHVVFILATTEVHKLPETIVSRTQRFTFRPVDLAAVAKHLRRIADQEKLDVSDEALGLIAAYGEGSFRDSISLLDQTRGRNGLVDADFVRSLIGVPTTEAIDMLRVALATSDAPALVQTLAQLREQGFSAAQVAKHLSQRLRTDVIGGQGFAGVFDLLQALLDIPTKHNPESALELALLGHVLAGQLPAAPQPATATRPTAASPPVQANRSVAAIVTAPPAVQTASPNKAPQITPFRDRTKPGITTPSPASSVTSLGASAADTEPSGPLGKPIEVDAELWPETLNNLKKTYNTLYGIARMAQPTFYADAVELGFTFAFHKKRLSEPKNREIIAAAIKQVSGKDMGVRCILLSKNGNPFDEPLPTSSAPSNADSSQQSAANAEQNTPAPDISAISNIFGGAEVLPG